jgi:hypothetical protein
LRNFFFQTVTTPVQPTTPRRSSINASHSQPVAGPQHQQDQFQQHNLSQDAHEGHPILGPVNLTPEQLAKMRSEVDVVKSNLQVFTEMLGEMKPGQEDPDDLQLLMVSCFKLKQ